MLLRYVVNPTKRPTLVLMQRLVVVKERDSIPSAVNLATEPTDDSTLKAPARILIAEDREVMRDALKMWFRLRKNWEVCGEANDASEAFARPTGCIPT